LICSLARKGWPAGHRFAAGGLDPREVDIRGEYSEENSLGFLKIIVFCSAFL